jgi:hypothetical protein
VDVTSVPAARPFVQCGVSTGVSINLYMRRPDDDAIAILFGEEQITLEFYDVESLERLRDLAGEGIQRLRASIELNQRAATAAP